MADFVELLEAELRSVDTRTTPDARARALALATEELRAGERAEPRRRWSAVSRPVLVAIAILLLVLAALTPPGRAVAEWIEDLVTGGDDTRPQTSSQVLADALLIGGGQLPGGDAYALYLDLDSDDGICVHLRWISEVSGAPRSDKGACRLGPPAAGTLRVPIIEPAGEDSVLVVGLAPPQTVRVEFDYRGRSVEPLPPSGEATAIEIDPAALAPEDRFVVFTGILPSRFAGEPPRRAPLALAFGVAEEPLGSARVVWIEAELSGRTVTVSCEKKAPPGFERCPR